MKTIGEMDKEKKSKNDVEVVQIQPDQARTGDQLLLTALKIWHKGKLTDLSLIEP